MINSWFLFPEMQDRPVIINLWGLTGIGKTSLIKRLVELLNFSEHYFRFDLGEFQLARTINEEQEEIDRASIRSIWDLLDSGKFAIVDFG